MKTNNKREFKSVYDSSARLNEMSRISSNFDKELFMRLLNKYQDIIETKKTDAATNLEKKLAWESLTREFNAKGGKEVSY